VIVAAKVRNSTLGAIEQQIARNRQLPAMLRPSCIFLKSSLVLAACIQLVSTANRNGSKYLKNKGRSLM